MTDPLTAHPKRFYKAVSTQPHAVGGFAVMLDGRVPKTPERLPLALPTKALADLVAAEWEAQVEHVVPATMPATRLAYTALDRVSQTREAVAEQLAEYAGSDLICYFADAPAELVRRQQARWRPLLDWAGEELDLVLLPASGIIHQAQPPETLARMKALALEEGDLGLTGLAHAVPLLGSAVLALALRRGVLNAAEAFALSRLDEDFQIEQWGEDEEAKARADGLAAEVALLERWFRALG